MISTSDLRKGVAIELDGELWQILDYHHIKMGRGSAQVRIKLRNVKRGQTVERSFQAGDKWPRAQLDHRQVQYLYRDGDDFHFMETESYEQFCDPRGAARRRRSTYLKENMLLDRTSYEGETIGVELPVTVDLKVMRRSRASPATRRPAPGSPPRSRRASSIQVPIFVNEGDTIRVDTRNRRVPDSTLAAEAPSP